MIYIFGQGSQVSIVYKGDTLTQAQKDRATLVLDKLPPSNCPGGFIARARVENGQFVWVYEEVVEEDVQE
jgi:hypothetical protein